MRAALIQVDLFQNISLKKLMSAHSFQELGIRHFKQATNKINPGSQQLLY
jgi:hypothetical protein